MTPSGQDFSWNSPMLVDNESLYHYWEIMKATNTGKATNNTGRKESTVIG